MHQMESEAAAAAARVIALSRSDADYITQHVLPKNSPVPVTVSFCATICSSISGLLCLQSGWNSLLSLDMHLCLACTIFDLS